ncbi:MAG: Pseudomurein-binding repeat protein [Methanobacterium sp. PtaU1.Bin242]|nr:MAG: Pseudomurein-binding repeat protein [Methanobacterium sp. PtaU1.Bin242]
MFTVLLLLGLTLTINMGFVAASDNQSVTTSNSSNSQVTVLSNSSSNTTSNSAAGSIDSSTTTTQTIKVLIYNGNYAATSCVKGLKTALDSANTNNLVPGYYFSYATSTVINSSTLSGYDVLAMPGGSGGYYYLQSGSISGTAIKNFVRNGGGYLGICAGAYAAAQYTQGYYNGWGLAPNVTCTHPDHEGDLTIQITSTGQQILNLSGTITVAHYNGPAMYVSGNAMVFATYADDIIRSNGMAAIVGDYYGEGRTVLSGPHPELDPQYPDIVSNLIVWAANLTADPTPTPEPDTDTVSLGQLSSTAATVKSYFEANKTLPSTVTINGNTVSMPQFLYLLATGTANISSNITSDITIKSVNSAPAPSGTYKSGNIQKSEYVQLAKDIITFINTNGRVPNYKQTTLGKISFSKLVYMYSKIINYYNTYSRLPNYVSMSA